MSEDKDQLLEFVAGICMYGKINPNTDNWLNDFLLNSNDEDRATFANKLKWLVKNVKPEVRKSAWKSWIKNYWIDRDTNRPIQSSDREKVAMIEMALLIDKQLSEIVEFITSSPSPNLNTATTLFTDIEQDGHIKNHPKEMINLLLHLPPKVRQDLFICFSLEAAAESLVEQLRLDSNNRNKMIELCEHLARSQCPKAVELRSKIP